VSRSLRLYLEDLLVSCEKILRFTNQLTFEEFVAEERTYDAVLLNLQIIGEAVKNIPIEPLQRQVEILLNSQLPN